MILVSERNLAHRYYANLLDYFIVTGLSVVYIVFTGEADDYGTYKVTGFPVLLIPFLWFVYFPLAEAAFKQTLGKALFNLMVISDNGDPATFGQCLLKRITDPLELAFFGIPAAIMITQSSNNKRIGDYLGNTITVKSTARCKFCDTDLNLTSKEAWRGRFNCPECGELNE